MNEGKASKMLKLNFQNMLKEDLKTKVILDLQTTFAKLKMKTKSTHNRVTNPK